MVSQLIKLKVKTNHREEMVDLTADLKKVVSDAKVKEGILVVNVLHTTAGLMINENADPDVVNDILSRLKNIAPRQNNYRHAEGNSDAHIKSALMGSSVIVPISGDSLILGTWQGIYLCEFDGPRPRTVLAMAIS